MSNKLNMKSTLVRIMFGSEKANIPCLLNLHKLLMAQKLLINFVEIEFKYTNSVSKSKFCNIYKGELHS